MIFRTRGTGFAPGATRRDTALTRASARTGASTRARALKNTNKKSISASWKSPWHSKFPAHTEQAEEQAKSIIKVLDLEFLCSLALLFLGDHHRHNTNKARSGERPVQEPEPQIQDPERRRRVQARVQRDAGVHAQVRVRHPI